MSRNTRIAVVLSGLWLLGICTLFAIEYVQIFPGQCVFDGGDPSHIFGLQGIFLSCNMFSDIPASWWGVTAIHAGRQIIELHTFRLLLGSVLPIVAIWFVAVICPMVWQWVAKEH